MEANLAVINRELSQEINPVVERANALIVATVKEKEVAVFEMNIINQLIKKVTEDFSKSKKATYDAWKEVVAQEKGHLDPLETAKQTIRQKIGTFDLEQNRLAEIEAARVREGARKEYEKQLEAAKEKIDAILSKTQDIDETIELLNMELKRDDLTEVEIQKLEAQLELSYAAKENDQSRIEEIHAQAAEPVFVPPTATTGLASTNTKVKGASTQFVLIPEVVSKPALIKAVANGLLPDTILDVNQGKLKTYVNMVKKPIPGVGITKQAVVSGRGR